MIGHLGLYRHDDGCWGMGFWLSEDFWRRGYMGEAAAAVVRFAFATALADGLEAFYFDGNEGSARILEGCGFRFDRRGRERCEARGEDVDGTWMALARADFRG